MQADLGGLSGGGSLAGIGLTGAGDGTAGYCMLTVIVDGNNVMIALGIRRPEQVEQFLQKLEMAAVTKDWEAVAVFDGPERYLPRETGPLVVRYMKGKTADSAIERLVFQAPDRSQVAVVTQDRAEGDLVRGFGAQIWSPQRLMEELR